MCDVSDAGIAAAYQQVRNDSDPTTWAVIGYADKTKLVLQSTGTGGFSEFTAQFSDDQAQFGYCRTITGDSESRRAKFIFVSWVGTRVTPLARARISVHKASVKQVWQSYAIEVQAENLTELSEDSVVARVRAAGGADYGTGQVRE
eukprot:TRINITY_DN3970_c0_g2_i1.p1 TRINITY_DN3970_c0_g2~~TRINITY_DN3970_c0_g2_i1.p1  ORF type:complete len:146 (+),score=54.13 TRINITY_DN3970_c0_g2_i1:185-622(+)